MEWISVDLDKYGIVWLKHEGNKLYFVSGESYESMSYERTLDLIHNIQSELENEGCKVDLYYDTDESYRSGNDIWVFELDKECELI